MGRMQFMITQQETMLRIVDTFHRRAERMWTRISDIAEAPPGLAGNDDDNADPADDAVLAAVPDAVLAAVPDLRIPAADADAQQVGTPISQVGQVGSGSAGSGLSGSTSSPLEIIEPRM